MPAKNQTDRSANPQAFGLFLSLSFRDERACNAKAALVRATKFQEIPTTRRRVWQTKASKRRAFEAAFFTAKPNLNVISMAMTESKKTDLSGRM